MKWITLFGALAVVAGCKGPAGDDGIDGADGKDGSDGADGAQGLPGGNGQDGAAGDDGNDGLAGFDGHNGTPPWGISLTVEEVLGGSGAGGALQVGDVPRIVFRVEDDDGVAYKLDELAGVNFLISGPSTHMQVVLDRGDLTDVADTSVWNGDGTWTYTSPAPIPAVYGAPPNDTPDIGILDGDWGGEPLEDGTYRIAGYAYIRHTLADGTSWTDADNAVLDVLLGAATTLQPREVVTDAACMACHGETLAMHGGSRTEASLCTTCHLAGAEDRYSTTDPLTTPALTVDFGPMIHAIHAGADRPTVYEVNGYPGDPALPGYPDYNTHTYDEVVFPVWPLGVASCDTCHAGAAMGDVENRPAARFCEGCHSDVDLRSGTNHEGGDQPTDNGCDTCHTGPEIVGYHADLRHDATYSPGNTVTILAVTGGTGAGGAFQVGDTVTVEFSASHDDGSPLDLAATAFSEVVLSGPTDHFQRVLASPFGDVPAGATYSAVSDSFTYVLGTIPATYPAQVNATSDLGPEVGEWEGQPLVDGTYRAVVSLGIDVTDGVDTVRQTSTHTLDVLLGAATTLVGRDVVDEAACETCHGEILFHGDNRAGLDSCYTCHTAGSEDRYSATDPTTTPGVTVDFPVMIHKIHNGSNLSETYEINGYGSPFTTHAFNQVVFPRFDGGTAQCEACHAGNDAWQQPTGLICKTCHDTTATAAHVALNTDPIYGESCDVCHGAGSTFGVAPMHQWGAP